MLFLAISGPWYVLCFSTQAFSPYLKFPATHFAGNLASKYAASFLYEKLEPRLRNILLASDLLSSWKSQVERAVTDAFQEVHADFLRATTQVPHVIMDQSGTTATSVFVTSSAVVIASLGDSRAVLSSFIDENTKLSAFQLTTDHVASDPLESSLVKGRGGSIVKRNGINRVNGILAITRSIGGKFLANCQRWDSFRQRI